MKKTRVILIRMACICLAVGSYYYVTHKAARDDVEVTEVQKVILRDLSGKSYPATPREVLKFYNRIICCFYNEEYTEDEFQKLADQSLALMDQELLSVNPADQYYAKLKSEVESYREEDRMISNADVCSSNDVTYSKLDGKECAYATASYFVRDKGGFSKSKQSYVLRKDEEGRWKILAFQLEEGASEEDE